MSTFSVRLQEVRKKRGLSKKQLAETLQITPRAYQYYEEGKREPPYDRLVDLARELDISIDYLLGLTNQ